MLLGSLNVRLLYSVLSPLFAFSQGAKYLKPEVVNVLVSGEVYCKAASSIFRDDILPAKGMGCT
jgi:hypothetical protein